MVTDRRLAPANQRGKVTPTHLTPRRVGDQTENAQPNRVGHQPESRGKLLCIRGGDRLDEHRLTTLLDDPHGPHHTY